MSAGFQLGVDICITRNWKIQMLVAKFHVYKSGAPRCFPVWLIMYFLCLSAVVGLLTTSSVTPLGCEERIRTLTLHDLNPVSAFYFELIMLNYFDLL